MNEFSAIDLTGAAPAEICPKCAALAVAHGPTQTAIAYCSHRLCGAYRVLDRPWKIIRGIEAGIFSDVVLRGLTVGELRATTAGEIAAILQAQGKTAVKH